MNFAPKGNENNMKRWIPLILLVVLIGAAYTLGIHEWLSLDSLQARKNSSRLMRWITRF